MISKSKVYKYLSNVATGIVGRRMTVEDAPGDSLGFTAAGNNIFVAFNHKIYDSMTEDEKRAVRLGVTVHECLHQIYTNFSYAYDEYERLMREGYFLSEYDAYIYRELRNIIEDPAIETMAPDVVGGLPLKALRFSIRMIDALSDYTKAASDEVHDLTAALIQFGDVGLIRKPWTFEKAKEVFLKIAPLFYEAINEPDNTKRIDAILPILEEVRTLYREGAEPELNEDGTDNKHLSRSSDPSGSGSGKNGKETSSDSDINRKRKITIKKVKRDEWERMKKEAEGKGEEDDGKSDITVFVPEDEEPKEGKPDEGKPDDENELSASMPADSSKKDEKKEETPKDSSDNADVDIDKEGEDSDKEAKSEGDKSKSESQNKSEAKGDVKGSPDMSKEGDAESEEDANPFELSDDDLSEMEEDDFSLSDEELSAIAKSEAFSEEAKATAEDEKEEHEKKPADFSEVISKELYTSAKCSHHSVQAPEKYRNAYESLKAPYEADIEMLRDELKEIFQDDSKKTYFARSGRVNLKRKITKKASTRIFERTERSSEKANIAIYMMVDMSGSTHGKKIEQERLAAILTAEALSEFDIPLYITGFTDNVAVDLYHFVRWDNTEEERMGLLDIRSMYDNFDAYVVRYAEEVLKERNEKRKLFIMLSDGQPASCFSTGQAAIEQNASAVAHMKEAGINVLTLGVGNVPRETFEYMYGKDAFVNVSDPMRLFEELATALRMIINGEEE